MMLDVTFGGKKMVFFTPHFFFNYKNVALFVLRAALPRLPACISHKHLMLINSSLPITLPHAESFLNQDKNLSSSKS